MKQISVRFEQEMYDFISELSNKTKSPINTTIVNQLCSPGDVYTTNFNGKVQLRINLTYLGDLLVCGYVDSFDGILKLMQDQLNHGAEVILQKNYSNAPYSVIHSFKSIEELTQWKFKIKSVLNNQV
ncbi:hypothetical protein RCC94_15215 [Exiguobacterium acetylicum]|uniref:hypothetical protein n=1 Tax=Exiguobacterium acetylicum TaxID=41170 RepID=UPI0027E08BAE|nr:hypothetical protein [Exiguobacterium acetylicum]MDQ6468847.1 hypothetical protein [Exiguobacterium acetylicum]